MTWVDRLRRLCPIGALSQELVKFDTQLMQDAEISGIDYQQGELAGYEVREYVLEKFQRKCAYCKKTDVPLEIEHIVPKSKGGSNRVSNLTLACRPCNQRKGSQTAEELGHPKVQAQAKAPLKDAAAMNSTRWALYERLESSGLDVETSSGGLTKFNRTRLGLPKAHWIDAACVGKSTPEKLGVGEVKPLQIKATGHGSRQMCQVNKFGFPRSKTKAGKQLFGFQTGDVVRAIVTKGKNTGTHVGKVTVRATGSFDINSNKTGAQSVSHKYCTLIWSSDGYSYI